MIVKKKFLKSIQITVLMQITFKIELGIRSTLFPAEIKWNS